MNHQFKNHRGFTVIELMVATAILGILVVASASIYANFYNSFRNIKAANLVYDEARFTMERLVKEVRNGTIDYEEYYNQAVNFGANPLLQHETYGQEYCKYSQQFYSAGLDGLPDTFDDESTGERKTGTPAPLLSNVQNKLYLIQESGTKRSYIQKLTTSDGFGKVGLLQMVGKDYGLDKIESQQGGVNCDKDSGEGDGLIDTWVCDKGFKCALKKVVSSNCSADVPVVIEDAVDLSKSSFIDITPSSLDIVDLQFFITPTDDPRKAYNDPAVQIQPHVTIKLTARAHSKIANQIKGQTPIIVLESTVSARAQREVITRCSQQECIDNGPLASPAKLCTKVGDVAGGAEVSCRQGIYPACTDAVYEAHSLSILGLDTVAPLIGKSFYEPETENGSCTDDACRQRRCTDGHDNDGNGLTDNADAACLFHICNNGIQDVGEACVDVGGMCNFRPKESIESSCFDGYDNDCSGFADELDQNCINIMCSNGVKDPTIGNTFVDPAGLTASPPLFDANYLLNAPTDSNSTLNEVRVDIGGICESATVGNHKVQLKENTDALCADGLDNDNDGLADELDSECENIICTNQKIDNDLVDTSHTPADYLGDYTDPLNLKSSNLDEQVIDIGGLCQNSLKQKESDQVNGCFDGKDNDIDGFTDADDPDCCVNLDGDSFFPTILQGSRFICAPKNAQIAGAPGQIDCNDSDPLIYPGAPEICDGATYPVNYPSFLRAGYTIELATRPIDNNCSGANNLTIGDNGSDESDPSCCVDNDGDDFGEASHYIYQQNGRCTGLVSAPAGFNLTPRTPYDCNDADQAINPSIIENTVALCTDGKNNNCALNGKKDHIDMYSDVLQAFNSGSFEPECCQLTGFAHAPDLEVCDDTDRLDASGGNSDDNCNGLVGTADHHCMTKNKLTFIDNFTDKTYVDTVISAGAYNETAGQFTSLNSNLIGSRAIPLDVANCNNVTQVILDPAFSIPAGNITYQVSNDGVNFEAYNVALKSSYSFSNPNGGNQLKWRATLTGNGSAGPTLNQMKISYVCQ